jgi:hypothetical protein
MTPSLHRRLALAEAILHARDEPPREGLAALLAYAQRHGWTEAAVDVDSEPRPLTGMARLLWEARHPGEPAP